MVPFSVQCSAPDAGQRVITVEGEVDLEHAADLTCLGEVALGNDQGVQTLVIDLASVTFMDSTGVGALVDIHTAATAAGVSVCIRNAPPMVTMILQISGLARMFEVANGGQQRP
ncbi:MAG TPA: STAS domain-containing protein [Mycobacterium sp.]|jgi:anti-anti-sigma factor|nr:STAS domain-containing protein [Mycobacterium sp.]